MTNSISTSLKVMDQALASFVKPYRQFYSNGEISLASVQRAFECLQNQLNKVAEGEDKNKLYAKFIMERGRCKVYSEAIKDYYENTTIGKVSRFFQGICKDLFGWKTSTEEAEELLNQFDQELNPDIKNGEQSIDQIIFNKQVIEELSKKTCMALARFEGANKKRAALWDIGTDHSEKALILKPDGGCYVTKQFIGSGANKNVYSGKLEPFPSAEGITQADYPLAIAIFSQKRPIRIGEKELQKELQPLKEFKDIDGIIQVEDSVLAINNDDTSVPIVITKKFNTLNAYLDNLCRSKTLTKQVKIGLMRALTGIVAKVHAKGKIHRDIKEDNILIDTTTTTPKPILIDFESCIDANDNSGRKKEPAGTNEYLAPEYASAILQLADRNDQSLVDATTPSVDIWALGLVLFRIYYGKSFLNEVDKKMISIPPKKLPPIISNISQDKINKVFEEYENDPIAQIIKNMLAVDPLQRKMPEPADWSNETA